MRIRETDIQAARLAQDRTRPLHTLGSKWDGGLSLISLVACDYLATAGQRWQETLPKRFLRQPSTNDATAGCEPRAWL